jgi:hypothetical protein
MVLGLFASLFVTYTREGRDPEAFFKIMIGAHKSSLYDHRRRDQYSARSFAMK